MLSQFFNAFIQFDGTIFLIIGLIVLAIPSPQPALAKKVRDEDLPPIVHTRRLLAAMFIASALPLVVIGRTVVDSALLVQIGMVRIASFILLIVLNIIQLRSKRWKTPPLILLITIFTLFIAGYGLFVIGSR